VTRQVHDAGQVVGVLPEIGQPRVPEVVVGDAVRPVLVDAGGLGRPAQEHDPVVVAEQQAGLGADAIERRAGGLL
jgi:hypothetical protein